VKKRTHLLLAATLAGCSALSLASAQASPGPAAAARVAKVQLRSTSLGKILVSSSGFTLYRFTADSRNKDACIKAEGCKETWPPLTTTGKPKAGPGVKSSLLSTIRLPSGARQVTYAGHPLYLYKPSTEKGETAYVGAESFGGTWYAVNAAGHYVK
jgi:predicted lipoprotein with Yx(FWY)xxD motif